MSGFDKHPLSRGLMIFMIIMLLWLLFDSNKCDIVSRNELDNIHFDDTDIRTVEIIQQYIKITKQNKSRYKKLIKSAREGCIRGAIAGCILGGPAGIIPSAVVFGTVGAVITGVDKKNPVDTGIVQL
jgi:hypothetical protein